MHFHGIAFNFKRKIKVKEDKNSNKSSILSQYFSDSNMRWKVGWAIFGLDLQVYIHNDSN